MVINARKPAEKDFLSLIGPRSGLWADLRKYLADHYSGHMPELSVGKRDRDWTIRYRRSGKTLVALIPEQGGFCALVVLGKQEGQKARQARLDDTVRQVLKKAKQFHDGRWLWIRPKTKSDLESVKVLLAVKRKPEISSD